MNTIWRICARVQGMDAANAIFARLDRSADAVSAFETSPDEWRVEAYRQSSLLSAELAAQLALAAVAAGGTLAGLAEEKLPARDWLADNQLSFPPLRVGRFFIHGSHHRGKLPPGAIGIALDAAIAFGTGEHPSTRGCLLALGHLVRQRRFGRPRRLVRLAALAGTDRARAAPRLRHRARSSAGDRWLVDPGDAPTL